MILEGNYFTFDLFNTVKDSDGNAETEIKTTDGTIIAPGTSGSFEINFENKSEVSASAHLYSLNLHI